jgi:hypothetical protein
LSYVTVRGEGKIKKGKREQDAKESVWSWRVSLITYFFRFNFNKIGGILIWYTDFYTALYFVNQRNYKTLAMQVHALTRTRYFYSPNVIISHRIVYKEGLCYLSVCAIASRSSPPSRVCISNGQQARSYFASTVPTAARQYKPPVPHDLPTVRAWAYSPIRVVKIFRTSI